MRWRDKYLALLGMVIIEEAGAATKRVDGVTFSGHRLKMMIDVKGHRENMQKKNQN